jgi:hypothetical protein
VRILRERAAERAEGVPALNFLLFWVIVLTRGIELSP